MLLGLLDAFQVAIHLLDYLFEGNFLLLQLHLSQQSNGLFLVGDFSEVDFPLETPNLFLRGVDLLLEVVEENGRVEAFLVGLQVSQVVVEIPDVFLVIFYLFLERGDLDVFRSVFEVLFAELDLFQQFVVAFSIDQFRELFVHVLHFTEKLLVFLVQLLEPLHPLTTSGLHL